MQYHGEVTTRKANEIAFARYLNTADDALQFIIDETGDAWRYVATVDTALLHMIPAKNGFVRNSFDLDVAISALLAAWQACGPKMDVWANDLGSGHPETKSDLRAMAGHVQILVRETLSKFNRDRA